MNIVNSLTTVNFNPGGMSAIKGIVLHSMWGTQNGSIAWFKNPDAKASAHFCISGVGEIVRVVDEQKLDRAWHAGIYDEGKCPEWAMPNPNNFCVGIELEDNRDSNWSYPEVQRIALRELCNYLMDKYEIQKDHVLLHRNLNPSRRSDPVGQFSFDWLFPGTPTVPSPTIEKIGKDQVLKDAYTALCGGFSEDEIKWRLSQDKNLVEIITDICNGDGRFFEKWIKPKMPIPSVPDNSYESQPTPTPVVTDEEVVARFKAIVGTHKSLLSKIGFILPFLA
jgi:hypothetical protein